MQLTGGGVVVTGGGGGLGSATAAHLAERGAHVVLLDQAAGAVEAVRAGLGGPSRAVAGDACDPEVVARAVAQAGEAPRGLRAVVACAGGAPRSVRLVDRQGSPHGLEPFEEVLRSNVTATFNVVRLAAAAMAQHSTDSGGDTGSGGERGAIVLTASIAGYEGQIGQVAYATAKAALIGMTLVAARDLAAIGVRVNCIAPGTIATPRWSEAPPELRATLEAKVPFPRFGTPAEFAALAEHLLTNEYLNGETVRLDGAIRFDPK